MDTSKQTALYAPTIPKVTPLHWAKPLVGSVKPGSLPRSSGLPADWRSAGKGDSSDGEEEDGSKAEQSSEAEEFSDENDDSPADEAVDSDQESEEDTLVESTDDSEEDGPQSILKQRPGLDGRCTHERKVSFGSITQKTDEEATINSKHSFRRGTDDTKRRETWQRLDPKAKHPQETQGTEVVTGTSGGSVAIMGGGRKGFVKKRS